MIIIYCHSVLKLWRVMGLADPHYNHWILYPDNNIIFTALPQGHNINISVKASNELHMHSCICLIFAKAENALLRRGAQAKTRANSYLELYEHAPPLEFFFTLWDCFWGVFLSCKTNWKLKYKHLEMRELEQLASILSKWVAWGPSAPLFQGLQ